MFILSQDFKGWRHCSINAYLQIVVKVLGRFVVFSQRGADDEIKEKFDSDKQVLLITFQWRGCVQRQQDRVRAEYIDRHVDHVERRLTTVHAPEQASK